MTLRKGREREGKGSQCTSRCVSLQLSLAPSTSSRVRGVVHSRPPLSEENNRKLPRDPPGTTLLPASSPPPTPTDGRIEGKPPSGRTQPQTRPMIHPSEHPQGRSQGLDRFRWIDSCSRGPCGFTRRNGLEVVRRHAPTWQRVHGLSTDSLAATVTYNPAEEGVLDILPFIS